MKNLLTIGLASLVLGGAIIAPRITEAYQGDPNVQGPNYTAERHEQMEYAFENADYNAWKELMQNRGRVTQVVTEQNFAQFAQAHELAEQGQIEEANQIREELGLGLHNRSGQVYRGGRARN